MTGPPVLMGIDHRLYSPNPALPYHTPMQLGRRIMVVGTSGSGKTYLAQRLAERLAIPFICNDTIIWGPNWTMIDDAERYRRFDLATATDAWTLDGNVGSLRHPEDALILERADTLIWIDLPRRVVMSQLLARTIRRAWTREPLWHGNYETWRASFASRDSILLWAWRTYPHRKPQYTAIFNDPRWAHLQKLRLTLRREVRRLIETAG